MSMLHVDSTDGGDGECRQAFTVSICTYSMPRIQQHIRHTTSFQHRHLPRSNPINTIFFSMYMYPMPLPLYNPFQTWYLPQMTSWQLPQMTTAPCYNHYSRCASWLALKYSRLHLINTMTTLQVHTLWFLALAPWTQRSGLTLPN